MKIFTGIYRIKRREGVEDDAWVAGCGVSMCLPETRYRREGYLPPFDDLLWLGQDSATLQSEQPQHPA